MILDRSRYNIRCNGRLKINCNREDHRNNKKLTDTLPRASRPRVHGPHNNIGNCKNPAGESTVCHNPSLLQLHQFYGSIDCLDTKALVN